MDKRESKQKVMEFLKRNTIAHIATLTSDGRPFISSVYYHANEISDLFVITLDQTEKAKNIKMDGNVAVVITDEELLQTAQIQATASEIRDPNVKRAILEKIAMLQARNKSGWPPPIVKLNKGGLQLLKITPTWVRYSDFKQRENIIVYEGLLR